MPLKEHYNEKFVLITEEVEICKRLSSNDVKVRRKGLSALKHLLKDIDKKKVVDVNDYNRIWNGIFNYVWMSDKLLVQEEDVESISKLIHCIKTNDSAMLFVRGFFSSLASQWDRISHYRTDKFLMFVRRFLRQILFFLKNSEWDTDNIESFSNELYTAIQILPLSLVLHLNDVYNEEIAKVSEGSIPTSALVSLLKCYVECIVNTKPSMNVVNNINNCIFSALARQLKLFIKQQAILISELKDEVEQVTNSDDEPNENPAFDPRPGNVNVFLPYIEFDENMIADFLEEYLSRPSISIKAKNVLSQIIKMFKSITNLRQSVNNPVNVLRECTENKRKRKRKRETLGSLIKKSCKRLELDEDSIETKADVKIRKKLEKMIAENSRTDEISKTNRTRDRSDNDDELELDEVAIEAKVDQQILKKLNEMIAKNSQKDEIVKTKRTRSRGDGDNEAANEIKANEKIRKKLDKMVAKYNRSDEIPKTKRTRTRSDSNNKSQFSEVAIEIKAKDEITKLKRIRAESDNEESKGYEAVIETKANDEIPKMKRTRTRGDDSTESELDEAAFEVEIDEKISKKLEKTNTVDHRTDDLKTKLTRTRSDGINESQLDEATIESKINNEISKSKRKGTESDGDNESELDETVIETKANDEIPKQKRTRTKSVGDNESELDEAAIEAEADEKILKKLEKMIAEDSRNEEIPKTKRTRTRSDSNNDSEVASTVEQTKKKQNRVSFNLEPTSLTYETESEEDKKKRKNTKSVDTIPEEIIVPSSAVKNRPGLLKSVENYAIVDFNVVSNTNYETETSSETTTDMIIELPEKSDGNPQILTPDNPAWITVPRNEVTECVLQMDEEEDDIDYDISDLFQSPPQKRGRRSVRKSLVLEVKRSERIANKMAAAKLQDNKKVAFTGKNNFQEVQEHLKTIQSRPELPYDASKKPIKSILKPFAVPSPINPFYYPNGKRKLKKRKVRDTYVNLSTKR